MAMATVDRYSRLVLWLKVALPLTALAILSTLFFVAETLDPEAAIPYAKVDVDRILREQGVTAPSFGGVTTAGVTVSLTADVIKPLEERASLFEGDTLRARLTFPSGTEVEITSPDGQVDTESNTASLQNGARLESTNGYVVTADTITALLGDGVFQAENGINADGPAGEITAGRMELKRMDTEPATYHLVFEDGVRLFYRPAP